jgi:hypothetical protein
VGEREKEKTNSHKRTTSRHNTMRDAYPLDYARQLDKHTQQFNIIFTLCVWSMLRADSIRVVTTNGRSCIKGKRTILATFGFLLGEKEKN